MLHIVFLAFGIFTWTFLEYCIHRFLGHKRSKNPVSAEHIMHHSDGNYFAPMYKKLLLAVIFVSVLTLLFSVFFSVVNAFYYSTGLVGMYLIYEAVHLMFHKIPPLTWWGRILRKHHFYHHYKNPNKNFGVTSRIWDRVFKTFDRANDVQLRVPARVATPWIIRYQNNEKVSRDYRLM